MYDMCIDCSRKGSLRGYTEDDHTYTKLTGLLFCQTSQSKHDQTTHTYTAYDMFVFLPKHIQTCSRSNLLQQENTV